MLDLTSRKFGKLTALKSVRSQKEKGVIWLCQCDCGNMKEVPAKDLTYGSYKSCGCGIKDTQYKNSHGFTSRKTATKLQWSFYNRWNSLFDRCTRKECKSYSRYGGRGIKICRKWNDFEAFKSDLWSSFVEHVAKHGLKNTSLDRINNDGNYCKSNCKWSTRSEQQLNRH